ncbi:hypothetical protein LTR12_002408 [Friedmanniomyces endolithicus]|nr:hypothetical protein LTR74_000725 [Friedmanniomyces endolithicus]KAK1823105.1 hypothetical protein LTR12_002408 [Friedmanniomyces endolithicus]
MLALVAGLLFATLTFSAPTTGNEKIVNAMSAGTLAKRDGLLECNLGGVPTEPDWQVRDSIQTFCTSQALGGNHAVVKPASQNPAVLYPIMATYYQDDIHRVQHHITLSIANISPSNPYTVNYNDCLKAFYALDDACAAVHTGGTWVTGEVFWSFDIDDAVEGPTKRGLLECNLGGVPLEEETLVDDAIAGFCTENSQLGNHGVAKPAAQNPSVLYPIMATYFESARFEPINAITLSIANHSPDKPYTVDYNECYDALMTLTGACSAQHTGGTYDAEGVFWSYDINNAVEGPTKRDLLECNLGWVHLEPVTLVPDTIQDFCAVASDGRNPTLKPTTQNPTTLYPYIVDYYRNDVDGQQHKITLTMANNSPTKAYVINYTDCLNALSALNGTCSSTGGTWLAENVFWSIDIDNAVEGPIQRKYGGTDIVAVPNERKRAVHSAAIAEVARSQAPTALCQVPQYATTRTSKQVVMAAFSQYCAFNVGVHIPPGGSVNQEQKLGGNYGKAIFGIDITDKKKNGYTIEFDGCMGLFSSILNDCGWSSNDGGQWTQGGRLTMPGGEVEFIMDLEPDKN